MDKNRYRGFEKQFGLEKIEEQLKEAQKKQELSPEQIEKLKNRRTTA